MSTIINQFRMSMLDTDYQLFQNVKNNNSKIDNSTEKDEIYAKDGDFKYDLAMDYNEDGVVTYDEYMRYCEENAVSQYNANPNLTTYQKITDTSAQIQSIRPINIGKAINTYFSAEFHGIETAVESEA